jgi:hypothetical protein
MYFVILKLHKKMVGIDIHVWVVWLIVMGTVTYIHRVVKYQIEMTDSLYACLVKIKISGYFNFLSFNCFLVMILSMWLRVT